MDGFKNFIPPMCKCLRDGKLELIPAKKLVRGDIIEVKLGDRIPADIRILSCEDMKVDNSSLTGESEPQIRSNICTDPEKILETKNIAFFGTLCTNGQGRGVVFNIGDSTIIG
jgi:sodium/potassium-transporting ATPase subunit alpha